MDVSQDILSPAHIKIAIFPIGNIDASSFKKYSSLIQYFKKIRLSDLSRFAEDNEKSPFKNNAWSSANLLFDYVDGINYSVKQSDAPLHKQVHGVVGILSCSSEEKIEQSYDSFQSLSKKFSAPSIISKCFGFDPVENNDFDLVKNLAIIPTDEPEKIQHYLEIQMYQIANDILKKFEKKAFASPRKSGIDLKTFSELSLLSGSLIDASTGFKSILDSMGQHFTLIGVAKQSMACIQYLQSTELSDSESIISSIIGTYNEVIKLFESNNSHSNLIESLLRISKFLSTKNEFKNRTEILQYITKVISKSEPLSISDRIFAIGECAKISKKLNFKRKFASFLLESANIYKSLNQFSISLLFTSMMLESYDIPLEFKNSDWKFIEGKKKGWEDLQIHILNYLISYYYNDDQQDYLNASKLILFVLTHYKDNLSSSQQKIYFEKIKKISQKNQKFESLIPIQLISSIKPQDLPSHLIPHEEEIIAKGKPIFYYNPFANSKKKKKILCPEGNLIKIQIEFNNIFDFDLNIKNISFKIQESNEYICCIYNSKFNIPKSDKILKDVYVSTPPLLSTFSIQSISYEILEFGCRTEIKYDNCEMITITPSLPLLDVEIETPMISLIDGESLSMKMTFQNSGNQQIDFIQLSIINLSKCHVKFNSDVIKNQIPFLSSNIFNLSIDIFGIRDDDSLKDCTFKIKYKTGNSLEDSKWYREISIPIKIQVKQGVVLQNCNFIDENRNRTMICNLLNESDESFNILLPSNEESFLSNQSSKNFKFTSIDPFESSFDKTQIASLFSWKSTKNENGKVVFKDFENSLTKLFPSQTKIEKSFLSNLKVIDDENDVEYIGNDLNIQINVGSSIVILSQINKKNLKSISSFFIYQHTENWKEVAVSEDEIFFNGKFTNTIPIDVDSFDHKLELYFFVPGIYHLYTKNFDEKQKLLSNPDTLRIEVKK
eukprot:gene390-6804_t